MKTKLVRIIPVLIILAILCLPTAAYAHGAKITYSSSTAIEIKAEFDGGDPMDEAQVVIYAPNSPDDEPWLTGECDDDGRFSFIPDTSIPGTWVVKVRKAGHGDQIYIEVSEGEVTGGSSSSDLSTGQIILMSVCVIWGLAGTALYFRGRRS